MMLFAYKLYETMLPSLLHTANILVHKFAYKLASHFFPDLVNNQG